MARTSQFPASVDPGIPVEPRVPQGWQLLGFGDVLRVVERPVTLEPSQQYRLVLAKRNRGGVAARRMLTGREILTPTQFVIHAGDFLISRRQIVHGACGVVPDELHGSIVSNEYAVLRTRDGLLASYLAHLSHTPYFQRTCFHASHGVDVEKMVFNLDAWMRNRVAVPPVTEQLEIVAILSSVDDATRKNQAVIDQVHAIKKSLMRDLLTRGLPGRHKVFKKTEIGEIPEAWRLCRLAEAAEVQTGFAKNKRTAGRLSVPYLRVANVQDGFFDLSEIKTVEVDEDALARHALRAGDVLFTEGGDADKLGRGCVWEGQIAPCLHQNHVFAVRPREGVLRPRFLSLYGGGPTGKSYFLDCAKRTTNLASINSTQLKAMPIPLPPIQEQDEILAVLTSILDREVAERRFQATLSTLKTTMMSLLLTGQVRAQTDSGPA